jgi:hypothetical protein
MAYQNASGVAVVDREAELHNSRINNMYSILKNAESEQLEQLWAEAKRETRASILAPEKPVEAPTYEHTRVESDLFTTKTLDRTLERAIPTQAPAYAETAATVEQQSETVVFSLTTAAKKAIAIFASAVTVMLTMLCVNTQIINKREAQIRAIEASNASMRESIELMEEQIEYESSEEVIREWAKARGLTD